MLLGNDKFDFVLTNVSYKTEAILDENSCKQLSLLNTMLETIRQITDSKYNKQHIIGNIQDYDEMLKNFYIYLGKILGYTIKDKESEAIGSINLGTI